MHPEIKLGFGGVPQAFECVSETADEFVHEVNLFLSGMKAITGSFDFVARDGVHEFKNTLKMFLNV